MGGTAIQRAGYILSACSLWSHRYVREKSASNLGMQGARGVIFVLRAMDSQANLRILFHIVYG